MGAGVELRGAAEAAAAVQGQRAMPGSSAGSKQQHATAVHPSGGAAHCLAQARGEGHEPEPGMAGLPRADPPPPPPPPTATQDGHRSRDALPSGGAGADHHQQQRVAASSARDGAPSRAPPPPPPPPPPTAGREGLEDGEWSCLACTLTNRHGDASCAVCGTARASESLVATAAEAQRKLQVRRAGGKRVKRGSEGGGREQYRYHG